MQLLLIFSDLYFKRFLIFFLPIIDEFSPIETDPVLHSIEKLSLYIDFNNDVVAWAFVELDFHFQNFWRLTWNLNIHNSLKGSKLTPILSRFNSVFLKLFANIVNFLSFAEGHKWQFSLLDLNFWGRFYDDVIFKDDSYLWRNEERNLKLQPWVIEELLTSFFTCYPLKVFKNFENSFLKNGIS